MLKVLKVVAACYVYEITFAFVALLVRQTVSKPSFKLIISMRQMHLLAGQPAATEGVA